MSRLVLLAVAFPFGVALAASLAACATPAPTAFLPDSDPAATAIPAASASAPLLADLAPVPQPTLPAALRPEPHGAMDQNAMDHGAMPSPTDTTGSGGEPSGPGPLADAVGAYLAVHDALASDRLDPAAAAQLADALRQSTATAPTDDPHLWHRMADDVAATRDAADALRQSSTLDEARAAFGRLGVPFSVLAAASGSADGLARHTCGMTDAPQGGVWLQRAGPVRNPYFGTAMLMCSRESRPATGR